MDGTLYKPQFKIDRDAYILGENFHNVEHQTIINSGHDSHDDTLQDLKAGSTPAAIHTSREVDSQGICTPGTRHRTLKHIRNLLMPLGPTTSPDIIWMHGPAGAGKSAIMRTIAQELDGEGVLLASFFFRSESRRNTSVPFVPTLALQAFLNLPEYQNYIARSTQQHPTVFTQSSSRECLHLLQTPLIDLLTQADLECAWTPTSPRVIVVDGLDECLDAGGQEEVIKTLVLLASAIRERTNYRLKVLVASRPEHRIKTEFDRLHSNDEAMVICLDSSDAEIHLFYAERLEEIRSKYHLPESWPSVEDLEWLTAKTSGQYALAAVSTRYLAGGDPILRLQIIRKSFIENGLDPFEPLDMLYITIFQQLPTEMLQPALLILRFCLGGQPCWHHDYISLLEPLLQLPQGFLSRLSPHLSSLIDFKNDLRPYHASLSDFLQDPRRSGSAVLAFTTYELLFFQTITKGLFASVSAMQVPERRPSSSEKAVLLSLLKDQGAILAHSSTEYHPSSEEIVALIHSVDVTTLDLWSFSYFERLCRSLCPLHTHQQTTFYRRIAGPAATQPWTHQMKATWQEKTASYGTDDAGDLIMGLLLLSLTTTHCDDSPPTQVTKFMKYTIQSDEELPTTDTTVGWRLLEVLKLLDSESFSSSGSQNYF